MDIDLSRREFTRQYTESFYNRNGIGILARAIPCSWKREV